MDYGEWVKKNCYHKVTLNTYVVRELAEETHCYNCGCPLYVGDTVVVDKNEEPPFCSSHCLKAVINNEKH